jgi:hypothetical protein
MLIIGKILDESPTYFPTILSRFVSNGRLEILSENMKKDVLYRAIAADITAGRNRFFTQ